MREPTLCAAAYFDPTEAGPITGEWLDEAVRLLNLTGIPIREFNLSPSPTFPKLTAFAPKQGQLRVALAEESPRTLILYAHRTRTTNLVLWWQASVDIRAAVGFGFLGVPAREGLSLTDVLAAVHGLTQLVAPCRYGIAYLRSSSLAPSLYAGGMTGGYGDTPDHLEHGEDMDTRARIGNFFDELRQGRRHLHGHFRSVYRVQLLSESHRQARLSDERTVAECGLGTWSKVEGGLWQWTLAESEMPVAKSLLGQAGLLLAA